MDLKYLKSKALSGESITKEEALTIINYPDNRVEELLECSWDITRAYRGKIVDMCSIVNAKSAMCPEDCKFCAQSSIFKTNVKKYPLLPIEEVLQKAKEAYNKGATKFGIVISARGPNDREIEIICEMVKKIKEETDIEPDGSLGMLTEKQAKKLKDSGMVTFNHNIETSKKHFPNICTTHTFEERIRTLNIVKEEGMKLCCGCIFGMGETREDRIDIAFTLREINPDIIPVNFLNPRQGTPLENLSIMPKIEAAKCIALMRFVNPEKQIKIAGGREIVFQDNQEIIFKAGADDIIVGDYLTTKGQPYEDDLKLIRKMGLEPKSDRIKKEGKFIGERK